MQKPLFQRSELVRISRSLGALLVLFGGFALIVQGYFDDRLPSRDGFLPTVATVIDREQIGSFQDPAFLVTLEYSVPLEDQTLQQLRSGQPVEFEQYFELSIGQVIDIHYDPQNISNWRINDLNSPISEYGLGLLMIVLGAFSLGLPTIVNWGSRQADFEFKDELDPVEISGANHNHDEYNKVASR